MPDPGPEPAKSTDIMEWSAWWLAHHLHRAETEGPYTDRMRERPDWLTRRAKPDPRPAIH